MRELSVCEIEEVNGGIVPVVAGAITIGQAFAAGFTIGSGVGAIIGWLSIK